MDCDSLTELASYFDFNTPVRFWADKKKMCSGSYILSVRDDNVVYMSFYTTSISKYEHLLTSRNYFDRSSYSICFKKNIKTNKLYLKYT